jgi:hypothetical protein
MADFPVQGGSLGTWGTELINFFKKTFTMDGDNGGLLAVVTNEDHVVCNEGQVVVNIEV